MNKFWNFDVNENGERTLTINGVIADDEDVWWYDECVSPQIFGAELGAGRGDITVWISSPGGDCVAASRIYTMLKEYKHGKVKVKIDGIAASAASVIAMAGETVSMSPSATLMIHDPSTLAFGNSADFDKAKEMLETVKNSIINAYELKTKLPRKQIAKMMSDEKYMDAYEAVDLGFADEVLYTDGTATNKEKITDSDRKKFFNFSRRISDQAIYNKYVPQTAEKRVNTQDYRERLNKYEVK